MTSDSNEPAEGNKSGTSKSKKSKSKVILVGVIIVAAILFYAKGIFVAATVNGSLVSRLSVVKELEKQGGKNTLEGLIQKKLIEAEIRKQGIVVTKEDVDDQIKKIEAQVVSQGGTLKEVLTQQGMTEGELREQVMIQKKLEKLLADKTAVTEAEIDEYLKTSKATLPDGVKMEDFRITIKGELQQQKFQKEAEQWVADLTKNAKINYYTKY